MIRAPIAVKNAQGLFSPFQYDIPNLIHLKLEGREIVTLSAVYSPKLLEAFEENEERLDKNVRQRNPAITVEISGWVFIARDYNDCDEAVGYWRYSGIFFVNYMKRADGETK
jgi:5,10-methenyltetrahydromethanopterin hydrogenase